MQIRTGPEIVGPTLGSTETAILTVVIDGANSWLRKNGGTKYTGTLSTVDTSGVYVGGYSNALEGIDSMDFGSVIIANRAMKDTEIDAIESELATKYGITLS